MYKKYTRYLGLKDEKGNPLPPAYDGGKLIPEVEAAEMHGSIPSPPTS
jgi:hypothetical protein